MALRLSATVIALGLLAATLAIATPDDEDMPGKIAVIRGPGGLAKFVAKSGTPEHPSPFGLPDPADDPTANGGRLDVFDTESGAGTDSYALPAGGWKPLGNPPASKGFKFKGSASDTCRVVLLKANVVKGVCKGTGVTLSPPFAGNVGFVLTVGTTPKHYCATFGGTTIKNDVGILKRKNAVPDPCPTTTTTSTTSTTFPPPTDCCGAERISLTSSVGTLVVGGLVPFPFPAGILTVLDSGAPSVGFPECRHPVIVPSGGFVVPNFQYPASGLCTSLVATGCDTGSADGRGDLWDAAGPVGVAITNVSKSGDTSDGLCNPIGQICNTAPGNAGANTLGRVITTRSASASTGVRTTFDVKVHAQAWVDSVCDPIANPGCCVAATFDAGAGDIDVLNFDILLSPTTDVATGAFADQNGDGCVRAGAGFASGGAGSDGPKSLTGTPAVGPCCAAGQSTTLVATGIAFTGGLPFYDIGFRATVPSTVTSCGVPAAGSCGFTDPCLGSPGGAFIDQ